MVWYFCVDFPHKAWSDRSRSDLFDVLKTHWTLIGWEYFSTICPQLVLKTTLKIRLHHKVMIFVI